MDSVTEYNDAIKRILSGYVELCERQTKPGLETILIMDEERGHYMWLRLGWEDGKRVRYVIAYIRIRNGKFWIEEDWTEDGIASDLLREGIPRENIVLAFHDPETRKHTDFAAA